MGRLRDGNLRWAGRGRLLMPDRNQREYHLTFGVEAEQFINLRVDKPGQNLGRKIRGFGYRQKIGQDGAIIPAEVAIGAGAVFPGVAPVGAGANDDYRSVGDRWFAARGLDQRLPEVARPQLAQAELGDAEVVDASRKPASTGAGQSFTWKIGADDVEFDFVECARCTLRREKKFLPARVSCCEPPRRRRRGVAPASRDWEQPRQTLVAREPRWRRVRPGPSPGNLWGDA